MRPTRLTFILIAVLCVAVGVFFVANEYQKKTESLSPSVLVDLVDFALRDSFEDSGVEHTVEYLEKDHTIKIATWVEGGADAAALTKFGLEGTRNSWEEMKESMISFCQSIEEATDQLGGSHYNIALYVLNDLDKSKTLLTIYNSEVVYDSTE